MESIENINKLKEFDLYFVEEPTSPDDILGFKKIKNAVGDVNLATGEVCQNRILFKQFLENRSLDFCQIDSCRMASLNEIIPVMLLASKLDIPIIPHAGGIGLCEYVQHLNVINKLIVTNNNTMLSEYAESCAEYFAKKGYNIHATDIAPGMIDVVTTKIKSESLKKYEFPIGEYWLSNN